MGHRSHKAGVGLHASWSRADFHEPVKLVPEARLERETAADQAQPVGWRNFKYR